MTHDPRYPPYPERMILLVEVGSTAHGTGLPGGEDHDETAIVVESPAQVLGLGPPLANHMQRTQPEGKRSGPGDTDRQVYSLRSFLAMAAAGNPSILLTLWAPVIEVSGVGEMLIGLREAFVGRHVLPRYRGYMQSQVMRMQGLKGSGHGRRGGGKRDELVAAHGYDTKFAMHAARLGYQGRELVTPVVCPCPFPPRRVNGCGLSAVARFLMRTGWRGSVSSTPSSPRSPKTSGFRTGRIALASRRSRSLLTVGCGAGEPSPGRRAEHARDRRFAAFR